MELVVYGINHNTAPVGIRETIAFNADTLPKALDSLKSELGIVEAVIVSTCNRTEVYCHIDGEDTVNIGDWLHRYHKQQAK